MSNHADMLDKYRGDRYDIHLIRRQCKNVAAVGRQHTRGGAAFGRATPFVVSCVLSLNTVNILAVTAMRVLHVCGIGHHVPRH